MRFLVGWWCLVLAGGSALAQPASSPQGAAGSSTPSHVIEAAGVVEFNFSSSTNWFVATNGLALQPGDKVRTHAASRAAVQLSDRSVIRLSERTTLEILPPRNAEKKRFGLPGGALYFFNRERPADVEFDTPLAAGAIRGTEFLLEANATDGATHLALIDGRVALNTANGELLLQRGEAVRVAAGGPPQKTALLNATALIQWALYYPAVLHPAELTFTPGEQQALQDVLACYRSGDLLAALASWPGGFDETGVGAKCLHAQLLLAVGRADEAAALLDPLPIDASPVLALRELMAMVRTPGAQLQLAPPVSASEFLARSYISQSRLDLAAARAAAERAVDLAPEFGVARARLAELEFAFGRRTTALAELRRAEELAPRFAPAWALHGFILLEQGQVARAQENFSKARSFDAAFGPAWLGSGLCRMRERQFAEARAAFQAAVALEPQRGLFRSYLGKAASEVGDDPAAEKEFALAKQLDASDPTAWFYSALHLWQQNRLNEALRDLEASYDRNDNRAVFRSALRLDQDRAVRSANLAALYEEAGIPDASRHASARAINESYADFAGHLFRANSLAAEEDANRFDLRLETARQSELLVANLLAPPGAGNLSQVLSQQDHLRFFDARPIGVSLLSEYSGNGDWRQTGTAFGSAHGFSYALDAVYQNRNGEQPNGQSERREFALTLKQRVTEDDDAYFQIGTSHSRAGDVANYYDPAQTQPGFWVHERQEPTLYAGWHHEWSPGSHTLVLASQLNDDLRLRDPNRDVLFLLNGFFGPPIVAVQNAPLVPPVELDFASEFKLYSVELQQLWETPTLSLVTGGRWQSGDVDSSFSLTRITPAMDQHVSSSLERGNAYVYGSWEVVKPLRLLGGVSYDHLNYPNNVDLPPLQPGEQSRDLVSPKLGILFEPWRRGLWRASYTKSLGGLYFDNSVRLEPTQVAGFNQAFRSLIPESVAGLVPGSKFETIGVGLDQSFARGTWVGVEAEQLKSEGEREVGAFNSFIELIAPATAVNTRENLRFRERSLSAYAGQLLGDHVSLGARYRLSEAKLAQRFPEIPDAAANLNQLETDERAVLHQLAFTANYQLRNGFFAQWESVWYRQQNAGNPPGMADEDVWQHNLGAGYRFPRRQAELRLGLLNLLDSDYRLNPLNRHGEAVRHRTFTASLRLNF